VRVIHVTGTSGTGKTTFIRELIPVLKGFGPTAVVKHLGHHEFSLEEGKDTTLFFESGASISAGVDPSKSVLLTAETDLESVLTLFCDAGIEYAIVEGFKQRPYPKVVFGNLSGAENVLLTDPSVDETLGRLRHFYQFSTPQGFTRELSRDCTGGITLVCTVDCPHPIDPGQVAAAEEEIAGLVREIEGVSRIRLYAIAGPEGGGSGSIYLGICATSAAAALAGARSATGLLLPLVSSEE
jgi:molybdopterin-guanine dinucleotide biosynthesis protein MobB